MEKSIRAIRITLLLVALGLVLNGIADSLETMRLNRLEIKIRELERGQE